ncbi:juvenile hormone epoxide hydrolase 1 [Teleopsis dalmanni]|uniref:juvenile hormone epoxide hydrolase 1 n=1 Tax=Teleopsis dalmanni TaxID=139649 RepID=UPI0018CECC60|nr:juvenile hormone epoxide hydrolase 1 [Teleopsis dalmanni]
MSPFMRIFLLVLIMGLSLLYKNINNLLGPVPAPKLPLDQWWGDGKRPKDWSEYVTNTSEVINNRIVFADSTIEDLRTQLNRTLRLVEPLEGVAFQYGFNSHHLKEIVDYWRDDYLPRWREREVFLWQFNQFTTEIQGLRMHFLHLMVYDENKMGKKHYPVLLLHGWPGSVREFYSIINKLHVPKKSDDYIFDVIVPSLPGYGWSQGSSKPGLGPAQVAVIIRNLMLRLGYRKFFVQGGDWGSVIGANIATLYPESVLGYHSNMCNNLSPKAALKGFIANLLPSFFAPEGFRDLFFPQSKKLSYLIEESGYFHIQSTKPDTIGHALTDNPVGLAAYILEKFSTWTNPNYRNLTDGGLTKRYKIDTLLDNLMIYYLTNSITTSQRLYAEAHSKANMGLQMDRVPTDVPTGCARFKYDIMHFLDFQLKDKFTNLIHSTYYGKGGHFIAMEAPSLLFDDFIEFVRKVEKLFPKRFQY